MESMSMWMATGVSADKGMATKLQEALYQQMESQSDMCDVTLVIGGVERKAHWCVLAICPYFESVYKSDMKEKLAGKITLDFGDAAAVRAAIRFLYTGTVDITQQNIRELLQASDYLQIERLTDLCSKFLHCGQITVKNCVGLCVLGSMYNLEYLYNRALKFMNANLPEVLDEEEVLTLTSDSILELLTNDSLRYVSVEKFFKFLVRWVEFDPKEREQHFCELFTSLDLSRVTENFLAKGIEENKLVESCEKCRAYLSDHKEKIKSGERTQETVEKEVILVTGGTRAASEHDLRYDTNKVESVYAYIISEDRWVQLPPLPRPVAKPLAASDGKLALYVIDSSCRFDLKQNIYKFVPGSKEWFEMRVSLPEDFLDPCVEQIACADGKVYVMVSRLSTNSGTRKWGAYLLQLNETKRELEMKCHLFNHGLSSQFRSCVAMGRYVCMCAWKLNDKIGRSSAKRNYAKFVYYDAEKDSLNNGSRGAYFQQVMYARRNEIVIARPGKCNARSYNLNIRKWRQRREFSLPLMKEEPDRTDYCYCHHDGHVYVFGGKSHTSKQIINSALRFDIDKKKCESLSSMPVGVMNAACCVMTMPTDMLRCHLECPHCETLGRRQLAEYHHDWLAYNDVGFLDEDDDDDDYDYDDDDDDDTFDDYVDDHWDVFSLDDEIGGDLYLY